MSENAKASEIRRWVGGAIAALVVLPILAFAAWTWITLKFTYASGERSGFVQKISKKGWVCKTWEGELAMVNLPGTVPQIFPFTVRDARVVSEIEKTLGQRVSLLYEQHRGIPCACFGDTEYFISAVVPMGASPDVTPPAK